MIFLVLIISIILAFLLRVLDVMVVFNENDFTLTLLQAIKVFHYLNVDFVLRIKNSLLDYQIDQARQLLKSYLFHYRLLLVALITISKWMSESLKEKVAKEIVVEKSLPMLNFTCDLLLAETVISQKK